MKKWQYTVLIIIATVIVVVGGFIGLLFLANKGDVVTNQVGGDGLDKKVPLTRSLDVKEWGVTMKTSELIDQTYAVKDENTILFSSGNQKMLSNGCSFKNQVTGPWGIKRYKASEPHPDKLIAVGDYVYEFIAPTAGCETYKADIQTLGNSYRTMYSTIIKQ